MVGPGCAKSRAMPKYGRERYAFGLASGMDGGRDGYVREEVHAKFGVPKFGGQVLGSQVVGISQDNVQISGTRGMSSGFRKTFLKLLTGSGARCIGMSECKRGGGGMKMLQEFRSNRYCFSWH